VAAFDLYNDATGVSCLSTSQRFFLFLLFLLLLRCVEIWFGKLPSPALFAALSEEEEVEASSASELIGIFAALAR
jgi:hypothetical protein